MLIKDETVNLGKDLKIKGFKCRFRIYSHNNQQIAIVSDLKSNKELLSDYIQAVIYSVCQKYNLTKEHYIWIDHSPKEKTIFDCFDRLIFDNVCAWKRLNYKQVNDLVGEVIIEETKSVN